MITASDITRPTGRPAGVYIGGLVGNVGARGKFMAQVVLFLHGFAARGIPLYARPLTQAGLHCVKKFGFEPVTTAGLGQIYRLDGAKFLKAASELRVVLRFLAASGGQRHA